MIERVLESPGMRRGAAEVALEDSERIAELKEKLTDTLILAQQYGLSDYEIEWAEYTQSDIYRSIRRARVKARVQGKDCYSFHIDWTDQLGTCCGESIPIDVEGKPI